jgi:hypothetical protein
MDPDPYKTPRAGLDSALAIEIPEAVVRKIRIGWIGATVSGLFSLGYIVFAFYTGEVSEPTDTWYLIDPALIFIFAFGIFKKNRLAATLLLVYDGGMKVVMSVESAIAVDSRYIGDIAIAFTPVLIAMLFLYFFSQGMIGTFQYHKAKNTHNKARQSDCGGAAPLSAALCGWQKR